MCEPVGPDWKPQAVPSRTPAHQVLQSNGCVTFIQIQSDETWLQPHRVCISHTSQSGRLVLCNWLQKLPSCTEENQQRKIWKHQNIPQLLIGSSEYNDALCSLTCPVAGVVEVDSKRTRFVLRLPGRRGAVLVVGVSVVVVDVLARQHGRPWRAAHGCGDKGVGESCASVFHDFAGFIHYL